MFNRTRKLFFSTRRRRWLLVFAVLFFVGSAVSVEVTSRPKFCNSCHIMGPYYESWLTSTHKNVSCVECHIAPGPGNFIHAKLDGLGQVVDDMLNRTSTKPSASVSDFACTRSGCHVIGELDDKMPKEERGYLFSHEAHLGMNHLGIAVHCSTCHSYIKGDKHFEVNTNVCFSCHLMNGTDVRPTELVNATPGSQHAIVLASHGDRLSKANVVSGYESGAKSVTAPSTCDTCHNPPQERFEHNGVLVDHAKYLSYGAACNSCHIGVTSKPSPVDDSRCLNCHSFGNVGERALPMHEMHRVHTEGKHKVECFSCHGLIQHGTVAESSMTLDQLDCRSCHSGQHTVQRSMYLRPPESHGEQLDRLAVSPMFLTHVPCTGCHVTNDPVRVKPGSGAHVARATPESCDGCHKPGLGQMQVPLWQKNTREMHADVTALLEKTRAAGTGGNEPIELLADAQQLLDVVRLDGSWGVHNPRYTQYLLERARAKIVEAQAKDGQ